MTARGPVVAAVDGLRIEQVLRDLAGNAVKFSRGGKIAIDISTEEGTAILSVRDHGPGMVAGRSEHVFDAYLPGRTLARRARAGPARHPAHRGIARRTDRPGLPKRRWNPHHRATADERTSGIEDPRGRPLKAKVLVVDDEPPIRELVSLVLDQEGYQVTSAENGHDALRAVSQSNPDVILLDLKMPIMDGPEFARRYRATRGPHAAIVVITAAEEAEGTASEVDPCGYLAKPFDVASLVETVDSCASGR